jgi:ABC-type multidrug transport system ATPase subunit
MATLLEPDAGLVQLGGYDLVRQPAKVRSVIGYMPDYFGVYDDLTVSEYLDFYARSQGVKSANRSTLIADLLALVDLSYKKDAFVNVLSRGMKQRLCLARCLVHDPQVLLLDEPASGLDPHARVEIRELLRELQKMGKTILVSSHILSELAEMCTEIGIVDKGKLLVSGNVKEIQRQFGRKHLLKVRLARPEQEIFGFVGLPSQAELDALLPADWLVEPLTPSISASELPSTSADLLRLAIQILQVQPGLAPNAQVIVDPEQHELAVDFPGTDHQLQQALAALLQAGLPICSFAVEQSGLEDIFLDITVR